MITPPSLRWRLLQGLLACALLGAATAGAAHAACGDGVVDAGEQCDDGGTLGGDCCSALCQLEPSGAACDADACNRGGSCNASGVCEGTTPRVCDDGLLCTGIESCDPALGCQSGPPGLGALFRGDLVVADPRVNDPGLDTAVFAVDPESGAVRTLSEGGLLTEPRDVGVEANRCVVVPDTNTAAVIRIDPLAYDPQHPAANQSVVSQGGNLGQPRGVVVAPNGDLFVSDYATTHRIHRIDPQSGAQAIVAGAGFLSRPRRLALDADGLLYVPVYTGSFDPAVVRIDPDAYVPGLPFANQEIVASGGLFATNNGPWDVGFDPSGRLYVLNAQDWNVIRVDVDAYDPQDPGANQQLVTDGGPWLLETRGLTVEESGHVIVTNEAQLGRLVRVDPDAFDPADPSSNQTLLTEGLPLGDPRGVEVVGIGACGDGVLGAGEECDDGNEQSGDCCSAVCQLEPPGVACDADACNVGGTCNLSGSCQATQPVVCDDGQFCNGAESCDAQLGCQAGTPPVIDDEVACTADSCDEASDSVVHTPNDGLCSDGQFCNGAETCDAVQGCQAGGAPVLDDGVACTADACNETTDRVVHTPNHGACSDGLFCNGAESCDPVLDCQAGAPPHQDGVACTADSCDEATDTVSNVPDDGACSDGQFCNGAEFCDPSLDCQAGAAPDTDDGVSCTADACDEASDTISHTPDDSLCSDGLLCTGIESCDPALDCQTGPPELGGLFRGDLVVADPRFNDPVLDPAVFAVDPRSGALRTLSVGGLLTEPRDVGIEANRCVLVPDTNLAAVIRIDPLAYDPQDPAANQSLLSQGGGLDQPRGVVVAPNGDVFVSSYGSADRIHRIDPQSGAQSVVAQAGFVSRPRRLALDADGLLYVPVNTGSFDPAVVRIDPDAYVAGDPFTNQQIVASGGLFATNNGPWDVGFDSSGRLYVLNAQDWNVIRVDVDAYDPQDPGANQQLVTDGGPWLLETRGLTVEESGHLIVTNEAQLGRVVRVDPDAFDPADPSSNQTLLTEGLPLSDPRGVEVVGIGTCGDGVLDPSEACDDGNEQSGDCCSAVCQLEPSGAACDADACNVAGSCDGSGSCLGAQPVVCDDGQFCNGAESCDAQLGCQAGTPPPTDDGVACTADSCDEASDSVVHAPNDGSCDDGQFCNGAESCDPVQDCQAGAPPPTDDGVACTADSCDEASDSVVHAPDDGLCSDGQFCNGAEFCDPSLDCQPGSPPPTDDGVACTVDACDEGGSTVLHTPDDAQCEDGDACTVGSCDAFAGCVQEPIPNCAVPGVSGLGPWGARILVLLLAGLGAGVRRRAPRAAR